MIRRHLQHRTAPATVTGLDGTQDMSYVLSREQVRQWRQDGALVIRNALPAHIIDELDDITRQVAALPGPTSNFPWLVHWERIPGGERTLTRVENFCHFHHQWNTIARTVVGDIVSQAFGEQSILFKDKINFKMPGGAGFLCHQDATAFGTDELASAHISALVAIDPSTAENGCLQVAGGRHKEGIFANTNGVTDPEVERSMHFTDVTTEPGDIVIFDSRLPHRSETNESNVPRRSAFLTYNKASEGDFHAAYYRKKAALMDAGQISINRDFAGTVVG